MKQPNCNCSCAKTKNAEETEEVLVTNAIEKFRYNSVPGLQQTTSVEIGCLRDAVAESKENTEEENKVKIEALTVIKQALDVALKNGAYSSLEEVNAILNAFKNIQ